RSERDCSISDFLNVIKRLGRGRTAVFVKLLPIISHRDSFNLSLIKNNGSAQQACSRLSLRRFLRDRPLLHESRTSSPSHGTNLSLPIILDVLCRVGLSGCIALRGRNGSEPRAGAFPGHWPALEPADNGTQPAQDQQDGDLHGSDQSAVGSMPHGPVPGGLGKVSERVQRVKWLLLVGPHKDTSNSATPPGTLGRYFFSKRFDRQPVREVKYLQRYVRTKHRLGPTVPRPKETARVCLQPGTDRDLGRERRSPG